MAFLEPFPVHEPKGIMLVRHFCINSIKDRLRQVVALEKKPKTKHSVQLRAQHSKSETLYLSAFQTTCGERLV